VTQPRQVRPAFSRSRFSRVEDVRWLQNSQVTVVTPHRHLLQLVRREEWRRKNPLDRSREQRQRAFEPGCSRPVRRLVEQPKQTASRRQVGVDELFRGCRELINTIARRQAILRIVGLMTP